MEITLRFYYLSVMIPIRVTANPEAQGRTHYVTIRSDIVINNFFEYVFFIGSNSKPKDLDII
jgi:hypothetical protein